MDNLINLHEINLDSNFISKITDVNKLEKLRELDLSNNRVSEIKGIRGLTNLKCLALENNLGFDWIFNELDLEEYTWY